jgi:hypothetical protein
MTTSAQDLVGIDLSKVLTNVGSQVVGVVSAVSPESGANAQAALDSAQQAAAESGPLAVYQDGRFPKLRGVANTVPWLWPLAGLAAIGLFVLAYLKAASRKSALTTIGIGVLITGILELLLIPAIQAPVQNGVANAVMQTVVGEVLSALTRGLAIQSLLLGFIGVILIIASHYVSRDNAPPASPEAPAQEQV